MSCYFQNDRYLLRDSTVRTRTETPSHLTDGQVNSTGPTDAHVVQYLATGAKSQEANYSEFLSWPLAVHRWKNPGHRWESEKFRKKIQLVT